MDRTTSFGQWMRRRRKALDLTQNALAQQAGCAAATIKKIEADARRPSRQMAERLATLLEIAPEDRPLFLKIARAERCPDQLAIPPAPPSTPAPDHRLHNLPAQSTALIGREREVASICARLRRADLRLVAIVGPGGVGKTRLALQAAAWLLDDFADGVYLVPLASISEPDYVAATIAQTLGLRKNAPQTPLQRVKDYLDGKRVLLLLDNFEHLMDAAPQIAELLAASPGLKILIASREALHLYGEHAVTALPLDLPDPAGSADPARLMECAAVRLFVERAQAVQETFAITGENAAVIAEICRRLDGLPLAIELAAARIALFSPQALLARLSSPLELLTSGARGVPARHQTLRAALDWSYDLLTAKEKMLFARLGAFADGCTVEMAEAICEGRVQQSRSADPIFHDMLDGLTSLLNKSLLCQTKGADGEPRFTMLAIVREYALERLELSGEAESLRQRSATHRWASAAAAPQIHGPNYARCVHGGAGMLQVFAIPV